MTVKVALTKTCKLLEMALGRKSLMASDVTDEKKIKRERKTIRVGFNTQPGNSVFKDRRLMAFLLSELTEWPRHRQGLSCVIAVFPDARNVTFD